MSSVQPLVSIVTIVFNGEAVLEKTIQSVIEQSYTNIEYIIIDGGSTDGTVAVIRRYEQKLSFWISEKDKGISDAFNKGIKFAKGEIIGFINASDWYEPDAVVKAVAVMGDADIVYGRLRYWPQHAAPFVRHANHQLLKSEMRLNHPAVFVTKKCYTQWGGFDENLKCAMDYDVLLRFYLKGAAFKSLDSVLANMLMDGISNHNWMRGCIETLRIKNKLLPRKKWLHALYFIKHVTAIFLPRLLVKSGLTGAVKKYRTHFSVIKTAYDPEVDGQTAKTEKTNRV